MYGKKLTSLGLALALVYSISLPARAELLKNLKTDGSIETRSLSADNLTDRNSVTDDHRGETNFRLMLGASYDLLDDVHGRLLVDRSGQQDGTAGQDLNTVQSAIILDNAYVKIDKVFNRVDLTIGRQFYGDPNDLDIYFGPNDDQLLTVNSVDLFRADADLAGWAKFQGIAGQTVASAVSGTNPSTDIYGAEINTDKIIPKGNLAVTYYTQTGHNVKANPAPSGNNTLTVMSVRAGGDVPVITGLGYSGEYLQNFGRNNTTAAAPAYDGSAYFVGLKYGHELAAGLPFRAKLEFGRGSRDFAAIAPGRRFGIIWGRYSNVGGDPSTVNRGNGGATGLSNLKVVDAGIGTTLPKTKIGVDVNWYRFMYDANVGNIGTSAGTEYDLILSYKHSDNVAFELNAATFQYGTSMQNAAPTGTSPATQLGADVKIKY